MTSVRPFATALRRLVLALLLSTPVLAQTDPDLGDHRAGSVLVYNLVTSGASSGNAQNTRVTVVNTDAAQSTAVRLFFVDGTVGAVVWERVIASLNPAQSESFLASDVAPGATGYLLAVAVDPSTRCPVGFNRLIGDADVKLTTGHHSGLAAVAVRALYTGSLAGCGAATETATLSFDGVSYGRLPRVEVLDNFPSRADGNDTLLVLNRLTGDLTTVADPIGTVDGVILDDATDSLSFTFSAATAQFRSSLSNSFPSTTPNFETFVPAGRSGWMKLEPQASDVGLLGAVINFNANAAAASNAFNGGHNLHTESESASNTLTIPVSPNPGLAAVPDDLRAGSVLVYNLITSSGSGNAQNTAISIANADADDPIAAHLFFVNGNTGVATDQLVPLAPNQSVSFLASDVVPGITGYAVAIAVDPLTGCPAGFNHLIGDADIKLTTGHHTGLGAVAIQALYGGVLDGCEAGSESAELTFDGMTYARLPRVEVLDNIPSRADGNDTLLVLNRVTGDLRTAADVVGPIFGLLYNDTGNALAFSAEGVATQVRPTLSNTFPPTVPSFETFIPAGRSGWMKIGPTADVGLLGAMINFNANANAASNAFNGGHNLHAASLSSNNALVVPVEPCDTVDISPAVVPAGTAGVPYSQVFSTSGGTGMVTLSVTGTLPDGLGFAGNTLSGTPTQSGTFMFTVTAQDTLGCGEQRDYTLQIADDGDGLPDGIEDGAPNGGDGNDDGVPDRAQPNVASLPSPGGYLTLIASGPGSCGQPMNVMVHTEESLGDDDLFDYPFGLIGFKLNCAGSSAITVIFHSAVVPGAEFSLYRKFGPIAPAFGDPDFYTLPGVLFGTTQIPAGTGPTVVTAMFTLTNGLLGDGTPAADAMILDPGGPALFQQPPPAPAPLLSTTGIALALIVMVLLGAVGLRRRIGA